MFGMTQRRLRRQNIDALKAFRDNQRLDQETIKRLHRSGYVLARDVRHMQSSVEEVLLPISLTQKGEELLRGIDTDRASRAWTRDQKIAILALVITILSALVIPTVRDVWRQVKTPKIERIIAATPGPKTSKSTPSLPRDTVPTAAPDTPTGGPVITSVSPIIPTGNQTVVIHGSGFGQHDPYNGCTNFLRVEDVANGWHIGLRPGGNGGCPEGEWALYVERWTDDEIVIGGFPGYGAFGFIQGLRVFRVGDAILITVANAQGKGIVNADPNLRGGPVRKFPTTVSESN